MKILLINDNKPHEAFRPFAEKYRLFSDWKVAVREARKLGWIDDYGFGVNTKPGFANIRKGGDVDLTLMAIDEE